MLTYAEKCHLLIVLFYGMITVSPKYFNYKLQLPLPGNYNHMSLQLHAKKVFILITLLSVRIYDKNTTHTDAFYYCSRWDVL